MMMRLLIVILTIGVAARVGAQCGQSGPAAPVVTPHAIVGLITDDRNTPLEHVEVILVQTKRKVSTNAAGQFRFGDLEPGKYLVTVRRIGYQPGTTEIELTPAGASAR